jgi:hypothetical protein
MASPPQRRRAARHQQPLDALSLYVSAFCLETSLKDRQADREGWAASSDDLIVGGLGARS